MADTRKGAPRFLRADAEAFAHKAITLWLPILYLLISSLFFLRTYDSAQVKITIMQMGGVGLLALWLCRLALAGRRAFNREDLLALAPFLAYLVMGIVSYVRAPYDMVATDFFLRHLFYMIVALIVIYEFDEPAVQGLFRVLTWAAWLAIGYGTLQFFDNRFFPPGIGKGIDPFVWRGAFGPRVFSTYGNPNFYGNFLVIMFPILLMQFLKSGRWSLLPLMGMLLLNLIGTGTKGAWVGFSIVSVVLGFVMLRYFPQLSAPYRRRILATAALCALGLIGYTAKDLTTRLVSINFRLFTWEATWEMIQTKPWLGSGVGAFPPLYPAFRRPPIFHIEGKHNTETDHAEDEYLEQWLDHGLVGFGLFIWLVLSSVVIGLRSLGQLTTTLTLKDGRPPPRAFDLAGVLVAFIGMLGHNMFDVSMRFVSSGVYLGLLSGLIVNVSRGRALYERHAGPAAPPPAPAPEGSEPPIWETLSEFLIWPARLAAVGGVVYLAFLRDWGKLQRVVGFGGYFGEFAALMGPLGRMAGGELLQWWSAWLVFAGCMLGLGYAMIRLCLMAQNPAVPAIVLVMLYPLNIFWGFFKGDIHHNVAIYFSKERNWEPAIANYMKVVELHENFVMTKYFLGNVFNDRFNMTKVQNPNWGDTEPRDDYERAVYWYNEVRRLAPNYVQHHHQMGNLHLRRAQWAMDQKRPEEAQKYVDLALNRYRLYEQLDPVFPPNYHRIGQIYMMRQQYDKAIETYEALIRADACMVEPRLLQNDFLRKTILSYQQYWKEDGQWVHRHALPQFARDGAEAHTALANAHYLANHLEAAEKHYKLALALEPAFENAKRNLEVVYRRAQSEGRLKQLPPPAKLPGPGEPPFTGYEIAPPKKK